MGHTRPTIIPHWFFGNPDCCGCLDGIIRGDEAEIMCNECGALVRTVPTADLERTLTEMELTLDFCTEACPHCEKVNVFPGSSRMMAYTCRNCGEIVEAPKH
jgi:hypothetical protein